MKNVVLIAGRSLNIHEYQGHRVVTFSEIASLHYVKRESITRNFQRNKKYFIEGVDYFTVTNREQCDKLSQCSKNSPPIINAFTESGYLMLVKSMTDDLAWKVQRQLVNLYFKVKVIREQIRTIGLTAGMANLMKDVYRKILYYRLTKGLTQYETGKILGMTAYQVSDRELEMKEAGINIPPQYGNRNKLTFAPRSQQLILSN